MADTFKILPLEEIPTLTQQYEQRKFTPVSSPVTLPETPVQPKLQAGSTLPIPSKDINDRISVIRWDITKIQVDAIVNAANSSLRRGGGVCGAIHRAAGPELDRECARLNGCQTGLAKSTNAYSLPCRRVIHTVGPQYTTGEFTPKQAAEKLSSCYTKSLELAVQDGCRTIAFPTISTGIYGYPSDKAAPVALAAIRKFLEGPQGSGIDRVVLLMWDMKDINAYQDNIPLYFPPVP
ncbi:uncharacterized protein CTHT_0030920 [Thermochaetoides thermophila DSM 1495]|uniref:Macro domain-containing protein n=1 Tax=Chaetomium thermophilum (strain DSM 1495 / CBS 144.50 / IMI 039719) TaxID=759272 RepID=G0S469_CHATD|nr:hypothetical protein CTHT_0030920 [Thermochaetoides thermophila DSM 1495]EGS21243.1 hypothetical protein CTHT_0030920 [Thermochaetoides thermophila DSM 1495]